MKAPNGTLFCRSSIVEPAGEGDRASRWNGLNVGLLPHGLEIAAREEGLDKPRPSLLKFKDMRVPIVDYFCVSNTKIFLNMSYINWAYHEEAGSKGVAVEESIEGAVRSILEIGYDDS